MLDYILDVLKERADITAWQVNRVNTRSHQLFLIKNEVESVRRVDTDKYYISVHQERSDDGKKVLGESSFVFLEGDPKELKEPAAPEPGVLLTDLDAPLSLMKLGLDAKEACAIIRDCAKAGLDAAGLAELAAAGGVKDAAGVRGLMSAGDAPASAPRPRASPRSPSWWWRWPARRSSLSAT